MEKEQRNRNNNYQASVMKEQLTTEQKYEKYNTHPLSSHSNRSINKPPLTFPSPPIICSNSTMTMISLAQRRQSNECECVRNDEIFNLHLGFGAGPWISISCPLQDTSIIHLLHMPKQSTKKKQKNLKKTKLLTNCIELRWPAYTEASAKRGRLGTQP